jgi:putative DNA primase/helicase
MSTDSLRPADLAMFSGLRIPPELLAEAHVQRVTTREARERFGIQFKADELEGLVFPYLDPLTGARVTCRLRRDHCELDRDGRPLHKYLAPFGDVRRLFFPPGSASLLAGTSITVVLVEAEKSALALTAAADRANRRLLAIGLGGCWGWKGTIGKTTDATGARVDERGVLPDFDRIAWRDRDVVILFDANAATNPNVQAAQRALALELTDRGARVRIVKLPVEAGINGPDDYVGKHGDAALFTLIDAALPAVHTPTKRKPEKPKQGRGVPLEDPDPWPDAVNGAALLDAIATTFSPYLALPAHASTALALWVLHVYAFEAWFTSPLLAITSPVKRCGKTLLLVVLGALVPRRLFASNVTPAVLFRTIEKYGPTLLIDEADTFIRDNDELRGVLNSGHTRTTAVVIRAVGDEHDPRAFSTWCPKAIALIGKLPDTLADRAIEVAMRRRTAGEHIQRLRQDRIGGECSDLRRKAVRWAADHLGTLQDADPQVPETLHDRAADCWRPLLAVADCAGGHWPAMARKAAIALSGESADDASTGLLRDVQVIFAAEGDPETLSSSLIAEKLIGLEDRPWREYSHGRPLSTAKLARLLAEYGIYPSKIRFGAKTANGYARRSFEDAWCRYIPVEVEQRNKANNDGLKSSLSEVEHSALCSGFEIAVSTNTDGLCSIVPVPIEGDGDATTQDGRAEVFDV